MTNKLQKIFFLLLFSLGFSQLNAASFEVIPSSLSLTENNYDNLDHFKCKLEMNSSSFSLISVKFTCTPLQQLNEGVLFQVCTPASCYLPADEKKSFPAFGVSATNPVSGDNFYVKYMVEEEELFKELAKNNHTDKFKLTFENESDPTDMVEITCSFTITGQSNVVEQWSSVSSVSPNPAVEYVNINLNQESLNDNIIRVYNELGVEVMSKAFNGKNVSFETNALNNGRYFFKVENSSTVINSGNFVVAR